MPTICINPTESWCTRTVTTGSLEIVTDRLGELDSFRPPIEIPSQVPIPMHYPAPEPEPEPEPQPEPEPEPPLVSKKKRTTIRQQRMHDRKIAKGSGLERLSQPSARYAASSNSIRQDCSRPRLVILESERHFGLCRNRPEPRAFFVAADPQKHRMKAAAQNVSSASRAANAFASAGARRGAGSEKVLQRQSAGDRVEPHAEKTCSVSPVREVAAALRQVTRAAAEQSTDGSDDGLQGSQIDSPYEEGCSCLFGTPCLEMNSHACGDWHNRIDVARRHGWQG